MIALRRPAALSALVAAVLLLASCGAATTTVPLEVPPTSVRTRPQAVALGRFLLGRAVLPPGSTLVARPPVAPLDHPPQRPGTPNLADASRFAVTAGTPTQAVAYLVTHRPAGFTSNGSGTGTDTNGGTPPAIVQWVDDPLTGMPPGVNSADLLTAVAPPPGWGDGRPSRRPGHLAATQAGGDHRARRRPRGGRLDR